MRNIKKGPIHTLPGELVLLIVDFLDLESLSNFRWTCRALRAWSRKRFSQRFRHRRFIFSPYSMQALVDISKHPVFGRQLQSISFGTLRHQVEVSCTEKQDPRPARQKRFINSGRHFKLLCEALRALKRHHTSIELGIFDDQKTYSGLGHEKMYARYDSVCFFTNKTLQTIRTVVQASRECDLPFTSWSMRLCLLPKTRLLVNRMLMQLIESQSNLVGPVVPIDLATHEGEHLFIDVPKRRIRIHGQQDGTYYLPESAACVCPLAPLDFAIGVVHASNAFMYLSTLELYRCALTWLDFEEILDAQAQRLEGLKMSMVCMQTNDWSLPFWDLFRGRLSRLVSLTLDNVMSTHMCHADHDADAVVNYVPHRQKWTGREDIQAGVQNMLTREDADCLKALEAAGLSGPVDFMAKQKMAALRYYSKQEACSKMSMEEILLAEFGLEWRTI